MVAEVRNVAGRAAEAFKSKIVTPVVEKGKGVAETAANKVGMGLEQAGSTTKKLAERIHAARTPHEVANVVEDIANGTDAAPETLKVAHSTNSTETTGDQGTVLPTEGSVDTDQKTTEVVDKAKAERAHKEKQFKEKFDSRFAPLKKELNDEYKDVEKSTDGLPVDIDKRNQYLDKYTESRKAAYNAELKATLQRDFEETYPPPNKDTEPDKFDKWITDREAYMNAAEEAKQEAEKVAKEAESGAGAEKQKAEGIDGEEVAEEAKEDASASMSNAFRLANQLENAQDDNARKQIEGKIQGIHDKNQKARPQFKTRVKIAQTIQIGKAVLLMSGMGLATNAVTSVASASSK